ncbi:MAG TPA: FAD-dependent oxidoreductase [Rubrobacteraceae bacterium]|nr:FAD-dependent oxidoreductase [Rubrobacteraceae bacterium]
MRELNADVIVLGGGTGGFAAALAAARMGRTVILTEETDWIGGQLTSQAVPPDEHPWIEEFGCTLSYRRFRQGVRRYFRNHSPLRGETLVAQRFRLGGALVSRVPSPPEVALGVLQQLILPYRMNGRIVLMLESKPVAAETDGDRVSSVSVEKRHSGNTFVLTGSFFLDATEMGDVLPITSTEYVTGAESREETGEPHAPPEADPLDMQAITWCFAIDHLPGEDHTIQKPDSYEFWREFRPDFWPDKLFSWEAPDPATPSESRPMSLFGGAEGGKFPLWTYRRLIEKAQFLPGTFESDITLVNWPQNDYFLGPVYEVSEHGAQRNLLAAREQSLSWLYWLQTEAPRPEDGGCGYPGLRLRGDLMGTEDGLAKYPYVRESRRIRAQYTVVEQDISPEVRPEGAVKYQDSVGVGAYRIDLHPSTGGRTYIDVPSYPFQIPLGSLIPVRVENLLAAAKNIGTTHITNGCYRLHPVEWNVGETAGALAAYCFEKGLAPAQVRNDPSRMSDFQRVLADQGFDLDWPELRAL